MPTPLGFVSEVGVAGLTLGGGLGYLTRRFGWAVDNLLEVELVTADGQVRRASRDEHDDLFWAIRGAGANFGVVTSFTFRLHEVGPNVVGGLVAWPFERADEILAAYRTLTTEAPRELAAWLLLLHAPPAPFVPPSGAAARSARWPSATAASSGRPTQALAPIRALGDPVVDLLHEQPYAEVQSYLDATEPKGICHYWRTEFLAELDDGLLDAMRDVTAESELPEAELGVLHVGGALNERDEDDGAVGNRDARYAIGAKAMWPPDAPGGEHLPRWVRSAHERLRPFSTGRTYVNFQGRDEDDARIRATYGAELRPPRRAEAALRPGESVPLEPEHRAVARRMREGPPRRPFPHVRCVPDRLASAGLDGAVHREGVRRLGEDRLGRLVVHHERADRRRARTERRRDRARVERAVEARVERELRDPGVARVVVGDQLDRQPAHVDGVHLRRRLPAGEVVPSLTTEPSTVTLSTQKPGGTDVPSLPSVPGSLKARNESSTF